MRCSLLLLSLAACAGLPEPSTQYFSGTSLTTSPDGQTVYSEETSRVRRSIDPEAGQITEEVVLSVSGASETVLVQLDGGNVFSASDDSGYFEGTITFTEGDDWAWTAWTYDLTFTDGSGGLTGEGSLTDTALTTDKQILEPGGAVVALVQEDLAVIDEATWSEL